MELIKESRKRLPEINKDITKCMLVIEGKEVLMKERSGQWMFGKKVNFKCLDA